MLSPCLFLKVVPMRRTALTWVASVDGLAIYLYIKTMKTETKDKIYLILIVSVVLGLLLEDALLLAITLPIGSIIALIVLIRDTFFKRAPSIEDSKEKYSDLEKNDSIHLNGISSLRSVNKSTESIGMTKQRIGQTKFREGLLTKWGNRCAVTSFNAPAILKASHIIPWKDSTDSQRLDIENGLLLSPNLDDLFDKHLISFKDDGQILISKRLESTNYVKLGIDTSMKLREVSTGMKPYLQHHRNRMQSLDISK